MTSVPFDPTLFDTASGRKLKKPCCPGETSNGGSSGGQGDSLGNIDGVGMLEVLPHLLYFPYLPIDELSDWMPVIVRNVGTLPVGVTSLELLDGEFEIGAQAPVSLDPGETVTFSVRFAPSHVGVRLGNLKLHAGTTQILDPIPLVGTAGEAPGSGSGVNTQPALAFAYRYGNFCVPAPLASEILLDYHVSTHHRLQSNFAGCRFSCGSNPTSDYTLTIKRDGLDIGTITFHPDGSVTKATTSGNSMVCPVNTIVTVVAPVTPDATIGRLRMVFVGVI